MATAPHVIKTYAQKRWNVSRRSAKIKYIVIHYTGTDASAKNNCIYFSGGNRNASADYFIDKDGTIYKFNASLSTYYTWHCGDGYGKYGITCNNSIGIEVVSSGSKFTAKQQEALRKLVTFLMEEFDVPKSGVVRHYDASRKHCPRPYAGTPAKDKLWKKLFAVITGSKETKAASSKFPYVIQVKASSLNVRKGAGTKYAITTKIKKGERYTVTAEKKVGSATWGKLKSGAGWIHLGYTKKV